MRIKITKCDEPQSWYADKIGEVFTVTNERSLYYYVDDMLSLYIEKDDCEEYRGGLVDPDGGDYPLKRWGSTED